MTRLDPVLVIRVYRLAGKPREQLMASFANGYLLSFLANRKVASK